MRICLITSGQPASNPRLVKEADALVEAGHDVHVVGAHWADWATAHDPALVGQRTWPYTFIDWRRATSPIRFWRTGVRQRLAQATFDWPGLARWSAARALGRVTPELARAARRIPADLYIAHNLAALPAAGAAAARHRACLGFDAEDLHRGQYANGDKSIASRAVTVVEEQWLPRCDYVTAASPGIAGAYAPLCAGRPATILNVFPLAMRPATRRQTSMRGPLSLYWFSQTVGADRGLELAVRAMGRLADGQIELHLRGSVSPDYRALLCRDAAAAGVRSERLIWHEPEPADQMVRLAARYDVGLALEPGLTRNNDLAISNKVFTYVLAGAAVAATSTTGQSTAIASLAPAAAAVPPGDAEGLARIFARWAHDRQALDVARAAAWDYGTTRFNWDIEKHRFLDVVHGVLRAHQAGDRRALAPSLS